MPNYPSSLRIFPQKFNFIDIVEANDYNDLAGEISAIELALGANIATAGTRTPNALSLVARLAALDAALGVVESRFDGAGLLPQAGVNGLVDALNALRAMLNDQTGSVAFASLVAALANETAARIAADTALRALMIARAGSPWVDVVGTNALALNSSLQVQVRGGIAFMRGIAYPRVPITVYNTIIKGDGWTNFWQPTVIGNLPSFAWPQQEKVFRVSGDAGSSGHAIPTGDLRFTITTSGVLSVVLLGYSEPLPLSFHFDAVSYSDVVTSSPYA